MAGVARAGAAAAASPLKKASSRAAGGIQSSYAEGVKGGVAATGGTTSMGTVGGAAPEPSSGPSASDGPPAWAKRMRHNQAVSHGVRAAAHAVRSGDSHGSGSSVNLSERDRS